MTKKTIGHINLPKELLKQIDRVKEDYSRDGFCRMAIKKEIRFQAREKKITGLVSLR